MTTPETPQPPASSLEPKASSLISWGSWTAIALVIMSFVLATIVAQVILSIYPYSQHWSSDQIQSWLDRNVGVQFIYTLLAYGLISVPIIWFLRWKKVSLRTIGLRKPRVSDAGWAFLALLGYMLVNNVLMTVVSALLPEINLDQKQQLGFKNVSGFVPLLLTFVSLAVIPPLVEEFVMRGFLFTTLRARLKLLWAVLITSLIFAAGHLQFGSDAPLLWVAAIDTFVLSLFLILLRVKTNGLWASILLHAYKNGLAFLYLFILHKG